MSNKIFFKRKDYDILYQKQRRQFEICDMHPLQKGWGITNKKQKSKQAPKVLPKQVIPSNPLSNDPLSRLGRKPQPKQQIKSTINTVQAHATFKSSISFQQQSLDKKELGSPWATIRGQFIKAYDIRRQNTSMLVANPFGSYGMKKQQQIRASSNLMQTQTGIKSENNNTQQIQIKTYLAMLEDYKKDLKIKWQEQDKVAALQITIQVTKLLHDTKKARFHALKFAYVIDIVQSFGVYVFDRIKTLSFPGVSAEKIKQIGMHQLENYNIPDSAQTICRNWLLKIGAIRELIPRSFIQATLIRLYFFMDNGKRAKHILYRLAKTNRCYGEYINSIFFSTFLIRIGTQILPKQKQYILDILEDVFTYIKQGKAKFCHPQLSNDQFHQIIEPFFKTAFEALGENLDEHDFERLTKSLPNNPHNSIIKNLISSFNIQLVGQYSVDLMKMIQRVPKQERYLLYGTFLKKLSNAEFHKGHKLIQQLWEYFGDIEDANIYLQIVSPFIEIVFLNFKGQQRLSYVNNVLDKLNGLLTNVSNQTPQFYEKFEVFLASILQKSKASDTHAIEPFLQTITYFPKGIKQKISQKVTNEYINRQETRITDPMIVNTMLTLIKNLEISKQTIRMVLQFIKKIDFGNDVQGQLNLYADIRAVFGYNEQIIIDIINRTILLAIKVRRTTRGKIRPFLQACIGFCYITIPQLDSPKLKAEWYLYIAEVALSFNLISQSNDLLKNSIKSLTQCKNQQLQQIYYLFQKLINFLIVTPDDPQGDYLFLFNGMVNAFQQIKSKQQTKILIYSDFIVYLSTQVQDRLPFHIEGVISNDQLFRMKQFREAVVEKLQQIFTKIESTVNLLKNSGQQDKKSKCLIRCILTLINVVQCNQRFEVFIQQSKKILWDLFMKIKDKKFLSSLKPSVEWIGEMLKQQESEIKWDLIKLL